MILLLFLIFKLIRKNIEFQKKEAEERDKNKKLLEKTSNDIEEIKTKNILNKKDNI